MFPKPEPRRIEKARTRRDRQAARRACWLAVYDRAQGRCETCGKYVRRVTDPAATEFTVGNVHEPEKRSQGADPTDPKQCVLMCTSCHAFSHHWLMKKLWTA